MQSAGRCHLLEDLPPELRLRIYEHLFNEEYRPSLLIGSCSKIQFLSPAKAHAGILKTCRTIYSEATPLLYRKTTFQVQIYPVNGFSPHGNIARFNASTPFLSRIQHLEIKSCILFPPDIGAALRLFKTFADALEEAGAEIKTSNIRLNPWGDQRWNRFQTEKEKLLYQDGRDQSSSGKKRLFQRLLEKSGTLLKP